MSCKHCNKGIVKSKYYSGYCYDCSAGQKSIVAEYKKKREESP